MQLGCSWCHGVRLAAGPFSLPSARPVRGKGSCGPPAFWCVGCVRTTGAGHTQGRAAQAGSEGADRGAVLRCLVEVLDWPWREASGSVRAQGLEPLAAPPAGSRLLWRQEREFGN